MTIQEVYKKWKHLDVLLSDPAWMNDEAEKFWNVDLDYDLWQAVKAEATKEPPCQPH